MTNLDRRLFLKGSGMTLAGFGLSSFFPSPLMNYALGDTPGFEDKKILFIFLRGGVDALNTVIPHGDPEYNLTLRPSLYIDPVADGSHDLNGFASLHPKGAELMDLFNNNELAVLHRIGYDGQSRSHFDSQRFWESGDPTNPALFEGWLYRYIQECAIGQGVDLPVITAQGVAPVLIRGSEKFVNVANPNGFDYLYTGNPTKNQKFQQAWTGRFNELGGLAPYRPLLADAGIKLVDVLDEYRSWDQANWNPTHPGTGDFLFPIDDATNPIDPGGPNGLRFPSSSYNFFRFLKVNVLALLESVGSPNGTRIAGTELGGWDSHNTQGKLSGQHPDLLEQLSYGMRSAWIALSGQATNEPRGYTSIWNDTIVMTMTEFGRTSAENGSTGTDHAEGGAIFVAGGGVNGGVYNCDGTSWVPQTHPTSPMFDVRDRYLSYVTDYRSLYWEILRDHMGAPPSIADTVFPGYTAGGLGAMEPGVV